MDTQAVGAMELPLMATQVEVVMAEVEALEVPVVIRCLN